MMPTASAVVSDVLQIAKDLSLGNTHSSPPRFYGGKDSSPLIKMSDTTNKYYLRFQAEDRPGVLGKITGSLGKHGISIESVIQKGRHLGGGDVPVVIMTHEAREKRPPVLAQGDRQVLHYKGENDIHQDRRPLKSREKAG